MSNYQEAIDYILAQLQEMNVESQDDLRNKFEQLLLDYRIAKGLPYVFESRADQEKAFAQIVGQTLNEDAKDYSFGALEPLLADPDIVEIMINGSRGMFYDKNGVIRRADVQFESNEEIMRVINLIAKPLGREINESFPVVDMRLPDGSRVNVVIPPISLDGPLVTIRKFLPHELGWEELIENGTISEPAVRFLEACVQYDVNIAISGGQGSGKSVLLNNLLQFTGQDERIITVERAAEIDLDRPQLLRLESRPPNVEGRGEISLSTLVQNAMKMRPDRIILAEALDKEALDIMQAMNTGIDGSMYTVHANTPRDMLARLESIISLSEPSLPVRAIREQIASATDLIIQIQRLRDGTRKVLAITEIFGMENNVVTMHNIFEYEQTGFEDGKIIGRLRATGAIPYLYEKFDGIIPKSLFTPPEDKE